MSLGIGSRIGPYEVTAPLGQGGMGVVFRARDTKLQRDVALKLLPEHLALDADRLKRFEREAQLLASLNHPHIAHVYGLESIGTSGAHAIAMELVEGETLAERISSRGPMPADEVVGVARQIASALEAAHERGIVHRDLKPANIKLRPDGSVKVLDFGLAKELNTSGSSAALSLSPTVTGQTMPGVIMGTLGYMSPEQARGKSVDARADIWAFGCVLFEMLAGRPAFNGETATDILAAVVSGEPKWERLPKATPAGLRQLLRVALTRDVRERLQHIGDSRLFFTANAFDDSAKREHHPGRHRWIPIAIGAVVLLAALVPAALYFGGDAPGAPVMRFAMEAPAFAAQPNLRPITASPDGRWIASLTTSDGPRLAVRAIDAQTWRTLPGTENAIAPFWSWDGRFLGFAADGLLKRIDVVNGTVQVLADGDNLGLGAWNRDNTILFVRSLGRPVLSRMSGSGGEITDVKLDHGSDQIIAVFQPVFLPDGRHFLYHVVKAATPTLVGVLYAGSLDGGAPTQVMEIGELSNAAGNSPVAFAAPGHLVFTRGGTLFAQTFDVDSLATAGEPVSIAQNVGVFDVSQTGVLVYSSAPPAPAPGTAQSAATQQLTWVTRAGKVERRVGTPGVYLNPRLSPDGRRIAVQSNLLANADILILDAETGVSSRLTFDAAADGIPIWSPSGDRVLFASARGTPLPFPSVLYERAASGAGEDRQVMPFAVADLHIPNDWSPDGRHIVYGNVPLTRAQAGGDLWALPLDGDRKPFPLVQSKTSRAGAARFSPDGRWLAYTTTESGPNQIVVRPFPDVNKGTWQVPGSGGAEPKWRGREIFYLGPNQQQMMAVTVTAGNDGITFSQPVALFATGLPPQTNPPQFWFDVTADGQRFLLNLPIAAATTTTQPDAPSSPPLLNVVVNWTSLLAK
jgi:Tol biopolymer transport system component/tRNA A-37 threonylcarbamoyl transferase component Bud32